MGWWGVGLAVLVPWAAGALWVRLLWRERVPGVWSLALGYGFLLGMFGITVVLRAMAAIGFSMGFVVPLLIATLVAVAGGRELWRRDVRRVEAPAFPPARLSVWGGVASAILLILIGSRLVGLALEVWWHPLFAWDAWTTWLFRTRVWAEVGQLVAFVSPQDWLAGSAEGTYTIAAWGYPKTVSLLALWPVLAYGGWNETAANLPWVGCALALALGFHGQARVWGLSALFSLLFLYLVFSLPLLDTHIALAGYADLWLAATLGLAFMAFSQWAHNGDRRHIGLAFVLAMACFSIKQEGVVWVLLLIPAVIVARLSARSTLVFLLAALVLLIAGWMMGGLSWNLPGIGSFEMTPSVIQAPWIGRFELLYHDSWAAVWRHVFVYDNWHLFGYLLVLSFGWGLVVAFRPGSAAWLRAQMVFVLASLAALFLLFFMTDAHLWAEKATSINRLLLHFVPAYFFWMMVLWDFERRRSVAGMQRSAHESAPFSAKEAVEASEVDAMAARQA